MDHGKENTDMQQQQQHRGEDVSIESSCPEPSITQLTEQLRVDRDHALAVVLQQQEREFAMLDTMETDEEDDDQEVEDGHEDAELEEEEEEEAESYVTSENDDDFDMTFSELFDSEFVEGEEDEEDEDDDIDPDELSYEELRELGEAVGEENRGLSSDQIVSTLSPYVCESTQSTKIIIDRCVICQVEYEQGEEVVALACQHPFHSECITPWLQINKICPICSMDVTPNSDEKREASTDKSKSMASS